MLPTGTCWCGCGDEVGIGSFFVRGHDKVAEAALLTVQYGGSVPQLLRKHGYGPDNSVVEDAVDHGGWKRCAEPGCPRVGTPASVNSHARRDHASPSSS